MVFHPEETIVKPASRDCDKHKVSGCAGQVLRRRIQILTQHKDDDIDDSLADVEGDLCEKAFVTLQACIKDCFKHRTRTTKPKPASETKE